MGRISARGIFVFAAIVFIGSLLGNWVNSIVNIGDSPLGSVLSFFIPTTIVYYIWKKWGESASGD